MRKRLQSAQRWVIKVGSSLLTAEGRGLDHTIIKQWSEQIATLLDDGCEVILVSSGSIAEGVVRLGWQTRPTAVHQLQAAAAVGQMGLIRAYEDAFRKYGRLAAQVLLTHEDLSNRRRYLNARATLSSLIAHGVVPIINENDTVTTDEIRLGDNDTLGALVANLLDADVLVLLTDQAGLFDRDPRKHADAKLLERANASDKAVRDLAGPSAGNLGRGGMTTKVLAAERAAQTGATTVIADGRESNILLRLRKGEQLGTMLTSDQQPRDARKRWLANQLRVKGHLVLDAGACKVLRTQGSSLLSVGVTNCSGNFSRGELVACVDTKGVEVARGLSNYGTVNTQRIMGKSSDRFMELLGYDGEPELVHRDNMIVFR
ncbi:MAG: glutamate 5-kinase [Granulosicoccus sp.]